MNFFGSLFAPQCIGCIEFVHSGAFKEVILFTWNPELDDELSKNIWPWNVTVSRSNEQRLKLRTNQTFLMPDHLGHLFSRAELIWLIAWSLSHDGMLRNHVKSKFSYIFSLYAFVSGTLLHAVKRIPLLQICYYFHVCYKEDYSALKPHAIISP